MHTPSPIAAFLHAFNFFLPSRKLPTIRQMPRMRPLLHPALVCQQQRGHGGFSGGALAQVPPRPTARVYCTAAAPWGSAPGNGGGGGRPPPAAARADSHPPRGGGNGWAAGRGRREGALRNLLEPRDCQTLASSSLLLVVPFPVARPQGAHAVQTRSNSWGGGCWGGLRKG